MADTSNTEEASKVTMTGENHTHLMGEQQNIHAAYKLTGKNYLKLSQLVLLFLSHLPKKGPKEGDPKLDAWDEQDFMVIS